MLVIGLSWMSGLPMLAFVAGGFVAVTFVACEGVLLQGVL